MAVGTLSIADHVGAGEYEACAALLAALVGIFAPRPHLSIVSVLAYGLPTCTVAALSLIYQCTPAKQTSFHKFTEMIFY
jgi:hypothetical protein